MSAAANSRLAHLLIALAGLAAVAIPVFVGELPELASSALFILPMIGAVAWTAIVLRLTLPRKFLSALALLFSPLIYGAGVLLVIALSMKLGVG